jgi:hypothetical protein
MYQRKGILADIGKAHEVIVDHVPHSSTIGMENESPLASFD